MGRRVLVVDDDTELCELLVDYLGAEGFDVAAVGTPAEGVAKALSGEHDLVVLDVMLPGGSGFEVLRAIRVRSLIPVIMLTARGDEVDRIVGLEMGADDYLPKPFNPRELTARIRAVERRMESRVTPGAPARDQPPPLVVGDVRLDQGRRRVTCDGHLVDTTSVEFDILRVLLGHAGKVVTRDDLASEALGRRHSAYDRSVDVHVSSLRRKIGPQPDGGERIKTVRGAGYLYALPAGAEGGDGG